MNSGSSTFYKTSYYNKIYEKDMIIQTRNKQIDKLKTELMNKTQENSELKGFRRQCFELEEQMKGIEKEIQKLNKEKLDIMKKRDENNSLFKRKSEEPNSGPGHKNPLFRGNDTFWPFCLLHQR